jgi:hypothetical protein
MDNQITVIFYCVIKRKGEQCFIRPYNKMESSCVQ